MPSILRFLRLLCVRFAHAGLACPAAAQVMRLHAATLFAAGLHAAARPCHACRAPRGARCGPVWLELTTVCAAKLLRAAASSAHDAGYPAVLP